MSVKIPNGSTLYIGSTYGASKVMSVVTNAAEAVATLEASHGVVANDILVVTSGWSRLNARVLRAKTVSTNDVTLEGFVTTDTTLGIKNVEVDRDSSSTHRLDVTTTVGTITIDKG